MSILKSESTIDGATYKVYELTIGKKTIYTVMVVTGRYNYVSVKKVTANPFGLLGTEFKDFDEAVGHYKNAQLKTELLLIELGI